MRKQKRNKLSNFNKLGAVLLDCPQLIKLKLIILLIPIYSTLAYCQSKAIDDPKWEFGTEVTYNFDDLKLSGIYVSRQVSQNFDLLIKTEGLAGIIRSDKKVIDQTMFLNYSELKFDKYEIYASLKWNKEYTNNTRFYATLGPSYRRYSYEFERGILSSLPLSGERNEYDFQIKSLIGGNVIIDQLFSISLETPISWYTILRTGDNNLIKLGPNFSRSWTIALRLGLVF